MDQWNDLFVASAGAAAALAGLLIVAMSVNVQVIISIPSMTSRAGTAIVSLIVAAVVSICVLIPGQSAVAVGIEVLIISGAACGVAVNSALKILRAHAPEARAAALAKGTIAAVPVLLFLIGGGLLCASLPVGLYWLAAGIVAVFIVSVLNAWVLLVEILR